MSKVIELHVWLTLESKCWTSKKCREPRVIVSKCFQISLSWNQIQTIRIVTKFCRSKSKNAGFDHFFPVWTEIEYNLNSKINHAFQNHQHQNKSTLIIHKSYQCLWPKQKRIKWNQSSKHSSNQSNLIYLHKILIFVAIFQNETIIKWRWWKMWKWFTEMTRKHTHTHNWFSIELNVDDVYL